MSLHKFAEQVAANGRGDDSLLVHMTPDEVRNLQRFAEANGTTLTINPTTGLPEAGLLSDLFKAVAPIALGAFLGPAGAAFGGGLMSAGMAGLTVGGITTLATGSLSRGLMAGLGAYGGAGLGESLMSAGTGAGMTEALAGSSTGNLGQAFGDVAATATDGSAGSAFNKFLTSNANPATMSASELASSGFKAAAADPMGFAKQNLGNLAYAAAPIAAGMMVPTTTKLPDPKDTGRIRQMAFNINPDTGRPDPLYGMREMPVVKVSDFGDKTFKGQRDLFYQQNPNPYQNPYELGVGSLNRPPQQQQQPIPMASGGIVALAGGGGVQHFALGDLVKADLEKAYADNDVAKINEIARTNMVTAADIADTYKGFDTSGIKGLQLYTPPNFGDSVKAVLADQNGGGGGGGGAPAYTQYSDQQFADYFAKTPNADIAKDTITYNADPAAVNRYIASLTSPFKGSTESDRGSGTFGIYNQFVAQGIDPDEYYKAALANDPKYAGYTKDMIQELYNLNKGMYGLSDAKKGVVTDTDWAKLMVGKGTWDNPQYDVNEMAQATGLSIAEVRARYELEKLKANPITKIIDNTKFTGTGTGTGTGGTGGTSVIPGGFYGNATNPGDITTNKDGTVTVHPNIPYRPYGGFSGIEEVSDAYTKGGGSLGYKAAVPKTAAEHNAMYNKLTDDSLDAYNFLMGKGKNLTQRKAETRNRPVMQRYDEAVLGRKIAKPGANTTTTTKSVVGVPGNPQSYFNEAEYLAANPDVAEEIRTGKSVSGQPTQFTSGYQHYLMYGKAGGRPFTGDYQGYLTAMALADAANAGGGGGPGNDGGGGVGGTGGGGSGGNAAGAAAAAGGGNAAPGTGNSAAVGDAASAAAAAAGVGVGDSAASGGKRGGQVSGYAMGGGLGSLGSYSDGGRLLKGPGDGVSDSIPATIGAKQQPARLADGEFVIPARIVSELGNGSTDAGAKKLYAMMDRVQRARGKTTGKNKVAANSRSDKYLPA